MPLLTVIKPLFPTKGVRLFIAVTFGLAVCLVTTNDIVKQERPGDSHDTIGTVEKLIETVADDLKLEQQKIAGQSEPTLAGERMLEFDWDVFTKNVAGLRLNSTNQRTAYARAILPLQKEPTKFSVPWHDRDTAAREEWRCYDFPDSIIRFDSPSRLPISA